MPRLQSWLCVMALLPGAWITTTARGAEPDAKSKTPAKATVAQLTVKGSYPEMASAGGLFGELSPTLDNFAQRMAQAAGDKNVSAVVLQIRDPQIGRAKVEELTAAIAKVRQANKRVIADLHDASTVDYLVALGCDEIIMPESGTLMLPGVRAEITFFGGLFEKLGVQADILQVGDFKGAGEPFTRKEMSPAFRQQYEVLLDDVYDQLVTKIAAARKLEPAKVRELVDVGLFTPADAQAAGLIDSVVYDDELEKRLNDDLPGDSIEFARNYGKQKADTDFSGMLGMVKMVEMMMGVEPSKRASSSKKIAVVYATGMIMTGESSSSLFGDEIMGGDTIVKAIRDAEADKSVVGIVLRIDSPGGSALASDLVWRALQQCKKPTLASMGDTAASGGYYIAMGCDKIYAEPGTLTGSIGVVGGKFALQGLFDKVGVKTEVISRGQNSGILSMDRPFTDSERVVWKKMMDEVYRQFLAKSAAGRAMSVEQLEPLAGGRVWTGRQAEANGLVDELGTLQDAIAATKQLAGLAADEKTELLILPQPKSLFEQLFESDLAIQIGRASCRERV